MQDLGPVKTHALSLVTQSGYKYRPVNHRPSANIIWKGSEDGR